MRLSSSPTNKNAGFFGKIQYSRKQKLSQINTHIESVIETDFTQVLGKIYASTARWDHTHDYSHDLGKTPQALASIACRTDSGLGKDIRFNRQMESHTGLFA